jgi:hypothetical protein
MITSRGMIMEKLCKTHTSLRKELSKTTILQEIDKGTSETSFTAWSSSSAFYDDEIRGTEHGRKGRNKLMAITIEERVDHRFPISPLVGLVAVFVFQGGVQRALELVHPLALLLVMQFPPLDAAILEPDLHLGLGQAERMSQVQSFGAHHILLTCEFTLQTFQLLRREDRSYPFHLAAPARSRT